MTPDHEAATKAAAKVIADGRYDSDITDLAIAYHALRQPAGVTENASDCGAISPDNRFTDEQVDRALGAYFRREVANWPHAVKPLKWSKDERDSMRAALNAALARKETT